jgi:hypothetical protein
MPGVRPTIRILTPALVRTGGSVGAQYTGQRALAPNSERNVLNAGGVEIAHGEAYRSVQQDLTAPLGEREIGNLLGERLNAKTAWHRLIMA